MILQEVVKALYDFLITYPSQERNPGGSGCINKKEKLYDTSVYTRDKKTKHEEEIIKILLLNIVKMNIRINSTHSRYLLDEYRHTLLNLLNDACAILTIQKINNGTKLIRIFNYHIKKLEQADVVS